MIVVAIDAVVVVVVVIVLSKFLIAGPLIHKKNHCQQEVYAR
jgi:hypothetical protein